MMLVNQVRADVYHFLCLNLHQFQWDNVDRRLNALCLVLNLQIHVSHLIDLLRFCDTDVTYSGCHSIAKNLANTTSCREFNL